MKKIKLTLSAAILALCFSAFSPATAPPLQNAWFLDDNEEWVSQELTPCTEGTDPICEVATYSYGVRRIFRSNSIFDPFTRQP